MTTSNVDKLAQQLNRAYKNDFPGKSASRLYPNYAMLINAKKHTNDANKEFSNLTNGNNNIKILAQDNIIDMVLRLDLLIEPLKEKLESGKVMNLSFEDGLRETIFSGNNDMINKLLDRDLKIETRVLSDELKALIINYAFQKWTDDPSWGAIERPITWLNDYFDYFQPFQFSKLIWIVNEYVNGYRSRAALGNTTSVLNKITPEQIQTFEGDFLTIIAKLTRDSRLHEYPAIESKFIQYVKSNFCNKKFFTIVKVIEDYNATKIKIKEAVDDTTKTELKSSLRTLSNELYYFEYPEEKV